MQCGISASVGTYPAPLSPRENAEGAAASVFLPPLPLRCGCRRSLLFRCDGQGTVTDLDDVRKVFADGDITGVVVALGGKTKDVGKTMLTDGEDTAEQSRAEQSCERQGRDGEERGTRRGERRERPDGRMRAG